MPLVDKVTYARLKKATLFMYLSDHLCQVGGCLTQYAQGQE